MGPECCHHPLLSPPPLVWFHSCQESTGWLVGLDWKCLTSFHYYFIIKIPVWILELWDVTVTKWWIFDWFSRMLPEASPYLINTTKGPVWSPRSNQTNPIYYFYLFYYNIVVFRCDVNKPFETCWFANSFRIENYILVCLIDYWLRWELIVEADLDIPPWRLRRSTHLNYITVWCDGFHFLTFQSQLNSAEEAGKSDRSP